MMEVTIQARPLADLEATIERGLATFVEVGQALLEIREHRLYRETHDSFEVYCRDRWSWSRGRADQMIRASEVSQLLDTNVSNEAQARELARLKDDPEAVREVWSEVIDVTEGKQTAADVREAVDRRLGVTRPTAPTRYVHDADSQDMPDVDVSQDADEETGGLCFECEERIPVGADECPACVVSPPVAETEDASPVGLPNTQAMLDATLRSDFLRCLKAASQIAAYAPERIVAVLPEDDAYGAERTLRRVAEWNDAYQRARGGALRIVGGAS